MDNIKATVEKIVAGMTLEEKVAQMHQLSASMLSPEELEKLLGSDITLGSYLFVSGKDTEKYNDSAARSRMKIPPLFGIDAIHGHTCHKGATVYPTQLAMACSFDEELIEEVGAATAKEVAADGQQWVFSPVLCIGRDPRWGRIDETFGEDTTVVSRLGAAMIKGYQRDGLVAACAKHYLGYGEATGGRDAYDTPITERKVRELFLPPFKAAVDAGCMSMMTAYGSIDATPLTASHKWLTEVLKEELGFEGFVVTDWANISSLVTGQQVAENIDEATVRAINAGNDMSMQVPNFYDALIKAVKDGRVAMGTVDGAVKRILTVKAKLGMLDGTRAVPDTSVIACREHEELCYRAALESCVLLKNDGILPLSSEIKKIAVIGANADDVPAQYGDWTHITHPGDRNIPEPKDGVVTALKGIRAAFPCEVLYARGAGIHPSEDDERLIKEAIEIATEADAVIAVIGDDVSLNGEEKDRAHTNLPGRQAEMIRRIAECGRRVVSVLINGKPLVLGDVIENSAAIVETFNSGDNGGKALAELLLGRENFSGRLPISVPYDETCMPCYYNQYTYWHWKGRYIDVPTTASYPFGYGLSYSSFVYSDVRVSATEMDKDGEIVLEVDVTNDSDRDGTEIVQLYFKDKVCKILTPVRTLTDFCRVPIRAHETRTVGFTVKASALGYYDESCRYTVDSGEFTLFISGNGKDFKEVTVRVK